MNYIKILKEKREECKISKYKLAQMTGITESAIRHWETGKQGMTLENADKVFNALGVTIRIGKESDIREDNIQW